MLSAAVASVVIGAHIHTFHFGEDRGLPAVQQPRDSTPGLSLRTESGLTLGIVRNSFGRTAGYVARTWETSDKRFALTVGAISGYRYRTLYSLDACPKHGSKQSTPCPYVQGKTNAHLRPLVAPSIAFPEARPYLLGATPRLALLGKGLHVSVEWSVK